MASYSAAFRRTLRELEYQRILDDSATDAEKPDYQNETYRKVLPELEYMAAVTGGTKTMRDAGERFLPRFARESDDDYITRKASAVAYNATKKTIEGLVGMVFRKDPRVPAEMPPEVLEDLKDIDRMGQNLSSFARKLAADIWRDGYAWVHVESPNVAASSLAEQRARGLRPYWVPIKAQDAINWQYEIIDGRAKLTLFVYKESATVPVGDYGSNEVTRYRVLRPGSYEVWEPATDETSRGKKMKWAMVEEGTVDLDEIPVVFCAAMSDEPYTAHPPLLDIAHLQVAHYRRHSAYDRALDYAIPMIVVTGEQASSVEVGPSRALFLPNPEARAEMLEMQGPALTANREQLMDYKRDMAQLGLNMLMRETSAAETAEAKRLDRSGQDSILAAFASAYEDALNMALYYHLQYRGLVWDGEGIALNRDYVAEPMDAATIQTLSLLVSSGQMRLETLWDILMQGEVLPANFDPEVESVGLGEALPL